MRLKHYDCCILGTFDRDLIWIVRDSLNPKTSWWIFPLWGVYIVHPATVVLYHINSRRGKKNGQINEKSMGTNVGSSQAICNTIFCFQRWEILIPLRVYMGMQLYHQGTCTHKKSYDSPLLGPSSDPARRRGAPRRQVNITSLLLIFHLQ